MKMFARLLTIAAVAPSLRAQSDSLVKKDVAALQGKWSMLWGEQNGQRFDGTALPGTSRTAIGNESTVYISGALFMKATFTVDPSKKPKAIDYDITGGVTTGKKQLGIYDVVGDTVRFCFGEPGVARPASFSAPAGSGITCSAWRKTKD